MPRCAAFSVVNFLNASLRSVVIHKLLRDGRFLSDIFANLSDASNVGASFFHPLESRRLMAADFPTPAEQYLVELINRARMDPSAEAARLGIALNEGLAAGTISTAAKQPLAINPNLTDAAGKHSQW